MFIDKDSLQVKISGGSYIKLGQYLVSAKYGYNKLWAKDSGRNLKGVMTGTLIGVFPKITCQFRKLTKDELEILAPILDSATQTFKYYDANEGSTTLTTYTGDWEVENKHIVDANRKNEGFSISFIAIRKR